MKLDQLKAGQTFIARHPKLEPKKFIFHGIDPQEKDPVFNIKIEHVDTRTILHVERKWFETREIKAC